MTDILNLLIMCDVVMGVLTLVSCIITMCFYIKDDYPNRCTLIISVILLSLTAALSLAIYLIPFFYSFV